MSALNASDSPAQDSPGAIDTQQLQQQLHAQQQHQDLIQQPQSQPQAENPRKPKTPSVRRACVACHTGKTRCSEHLPCQSCIKRGLAQTCAYPDPDTDHNHHPPGMPHAHLHDFAITTAPPPDPSAPSSSSSTTAATSFAPPPLYATIQGTTTLAHQQYYDYNGGYTGASTSTFRPNKRPRNLTEEETAAITRNFTRGDFYIGNNAPLFSTFYLIVYYQLLALGQIFLIL
ncbi:hypothetical protein C0991_010054 [Blastosporella zonata]|nr:hypothetical protein C0991_010054 [Blastosporella zonata]